MEKGLKTSPHKTAQKWKGPSKWWKDKTTKAKIWIKDSLRKCPTEQSKTEQIARDRDRKTEPERIPLYKNKSFDISLHREFLYTSHTDFFCMRGVSIRHPALLFFHFSFFHFYLGSFSYTSHAGLIFTWGVSLTHPLLALFFFGECLLHIPWWIHFLIFYFIWGVSLSHPVLASFLSGEFLLHIPCWLLFLSPQVLLHIPCWLRLFIGAVSLKHPVLVLFFLSGSFSYTSHVGVIFMWGVSLTHPVLASLLSEEFFLHIQCWL